MRLPIALAFVFSFGSSACMVSTRPGPNGPPPSERRGPPPMEHERYIEGTVVDAVSHQPIGRAAIDITSPALGGKEMTTTTDESGHYRTDRLPRGEFSIRVRREGFEVIDRPANVVDGPARLDIELMPKRR